MKRIALAFVALAIVCACATAGHADKLTEANMTKKDFDEITKTESSVPGENRATPPTPVHDFNAADEQAVKDAHGVKVIKGKDWKKLSPKDRDKQLRELKKTLDKDAGLFIEVPSGDVWAVDDAEYMKLKMNLALRRWTLDEEEALPKAVKRDPLEKPEDRRNDRPLGSLRTDFRL